MKTINFPKSLAILAIASLAALAFSAEAQQTTVTSATPPAVASTAQPMPYGVTQIVQLAQAKVGDDTIIAYVKNSGNSYNLDADQIISLRQQGVSDVVITTMLNQPKAGVAAVSQPAPATPAPTTAEVTTASAGGSTATYDSSAAVVPTASVAPSVTYVQTVPTYYYSSPYYYPYYYGYGYYPGVSIGFGYGGWYGGGYPY
jgi:hypothetical protein